MLSFNHTPHATHPDNSLSSPSKYSQSPATSRIGQLTIIQLLACTAFHLGLLLLHFLPYHLFSTQKAERFFFKAHIKSRHPSAQNLAVTCSASVCSKTVAL